MKLTIPTFYALYGRYINRFRAIPYYIDALKPVERRLLLSLLKAKKKQKSALIIGYCIGHYHPHGDQCLPGDTKIYSLDGNIYTIRQLAENNAEIEVLAFDTEKKQIVPAKAIHFRKTKKERKLYKIHFSNKTHILSTDNHPFYVIGQGFVRADELKPYDEVLTASIQYKSKLRLQNIKQTNSIHKIEIIELDDDIDVYDFTVPKYENMFVVTGEDENRLHLVCVHNSVYDSLVQLVHRGFAEGQGNWGSPGLDNEFKAAAYRYTEVKRNEFLTQLFKEFLQFAEHETLELTSEPLYLPCPVPIGLIGSSITTGISFYTTKIPHYTYLDLLKRLQYLLEKERNQDVEEPIIKPNINGCNIYEDSPGEFKRILIEGEGTIQVIPITEIDYDQNCVIIKGKVPTERGGFGKLKKSQEALGIGIIDASSASEGYRIIIEPPGRRRVTPDFEMEILKLISSRIKIICNFVDDQNRVDVSSIDTVLLRNYNKWLRCYTLDRKSKLKAVRDKLYEITVIEVVRQILHDNPAVKKVQDIIDIYNQNKQYQMQNINDESIRYVCSKHSIQKLIEHTIDKTRVLNDIKALEHEIEHIDEFGFNRIKSLQQA